MHTFLQPYYRGLLYSSFYSIFGRVQPETNPALFHQYLKLVYPVVVSDREGARLFTRAILADLARNNQSGNKKYSYFNRQDNLHASGATHVNEEKINARERILTPYEEVYLPQVMTEMEHILITRLALGTGVRVREILDLKRSEIMWANNRLSIIREGERIRRYVIDDSTTHALMMVTRALEGTKQKMLFTTGAHGLRRALIRAGTKLQIGPVGGRSLEDTFARRKIQNGYTIKCISHLMGMDMETTRRRYGMEQKDYFNSLADFSKPVRLR